ncbi:carbohydrate sulfotransferase 11-like isoform X1 [Neodiprion fabricii]|uniref:carbohydrate sulfotransferase 11-like isoform X1 n=1 Tax=Neodiprion fabricii TaxID=2872261 RepID=UPI001ED98269|nr:carbohydrate sulfotransferase 11-like isoform X1 [Neodiprion fabricii]
MKKWSVIRLTSLIGGLAAITSIVTIIFLIKKIEGDYTRDAVKPHQTDSHELRLLLDEANRDNNRRISTVEETCKRRHLGRYQDRNFESFYKHPPAPQYTVFFIDMVHNLSYCPVYKAGSTTWFYNLCLLNGIPEEALANSSGQISIIARSVLPEMELSEAVEALEKSRKLLVVRHPFERLLSAYRDKLENSVAGREHGTLHFYKKYGSKIVAKFRDERIAPPRSDQVIRPKDIPPPAGIEPTWREFVQYLIHTDLASYGDDHWMPYYLFCTPCLIRFNIIAKVETLWRDQIFAIHELGMENQLTPKWRHSNAGSSSAAEIYFTQLTPNLVRQLYEKFKLDFELFDYSPMDYYEYATGDAP